MCSTELRVDARDGSLIKYEEFMDDGNYKRRLPSASNVFFKRKFITGKPYNLIKSDIIVFIRKSAMFSKEQKPLDARIIFINENPLSDRYIPVIVLEKQFFRANQVKKSYLY